MDWRTLALTIIAGTVLGVGAFIINGVWNHASVASVEAVEKDVEAVEDELHAYIAETQAHWIKQATFRGAVVQALKIQLPPED